MDTAYIHSFTKDLLTKLGVPAEVEVKDDEDLNMTVFSIKTEESNMLIGHHGETLNALSHVIKKAADNHGEKGEKQYFIVDVNDYQRKRINEIKGKATILGERARYFKSSVEMEPMSPYERMIVHSIFAETKDIETESGGFGRDRHVVVKYKEPDEEIF